MLHKNCIQVLGILLALLLLACTKEEGVKPEQNLVAVPFKISADKGRMLLTSFSDGTTHTVNRILLLPFKKINEGGENEDSNFEPEYSLAKQLDVSHFSVFATVDTLDAFLQLAPGTSYQVMVIGYNSSDYNYDAGNPTAAGEHFSMAGSNLGDMRLSLISPTVVPEFFGAICEVYINGASASSSVFTPGVSMLSLKGNLTHKVSGLSLEITNISDVVDSIVLTAEQVVTAMSMKDGAPVSGQIASNVKLGVEIPVGGTATFERYLMPTLDTYATKLYLNIYHGDTNELYTVNVPDVAGVSRNDSIIFNPNELVSITGNYAENIGFTVGKNINLDEDEWDGIQP